MAGWLVHVGIVGLLMPAFAMPPPRLSPKHTHADREDGPDGLKLERTHRGGFRHRDRDNGFEATIHPDGSVTFRDITRAKAKTSYKPDPDGTVGGMLRGPYAPQQSPNEATGNPILPPSPYGAAPIILSAGTSIGGLADIGADGRRSAKRAFLRSTQDMRDRMARAAERRRLRRALVGLRLRLSELWNDPARTAAQKRAALFALWDEAEERPVVALGAAGASMQPGAPAPLTRSGAGERARRRIEAFIRIVAPKGSAQAYGPAELRALNRRRTSHQRFAPYRTAAPHTARP
ncbi:MAG: hypothetical protein AAF721_18190 [Myxococcota bacterium]